MGSENNHIPVKSPTIVRPANMLNFGDAVKKAVEGRRITRFEWGDNRKYGLLHAGFLHIHKNGESSDTLHVWMVNDGDIMSEDWILLPEQN